MRVGITRPHANWLAIMQRLLQRIEHEAGMGRPANPPTNDLAGIDVDHERDINEPTPVSPNNATASLTI